MSKVSNKFLAQMAANTVKANITGSTANPTDVSAVSAATASTFMVRDSNANVKANNHIPGLTTTATAAGSTTLTSASTWLQQFTGSTTQTVVLPDATTLSVGWSFFITNRSSGVVTVNANGGGLIQTMAAGSQVLVSAVTIGTSAGVWDAAYSSSSSGLSSTLTSAHIFVGNGSNVATDVAVTGDVTISNAGVTALGTNKVTNTMLAQMAANTVKANLTGSTANAADASAVAAATASTVMTRDSNANSALNNLIRNGSSTATAAGTTTLTVSSTWFQQFTGSTTQTVVLPDATTLTLYHSFLITNRSSGIVTVNKNGGTLVQTMAAGSQTIVTVTNIGTAAGSWDSAYSTTAAGGGGSSVAQTSSTGSGQAPSGTTAQRDGSPSNGYFRYNTDQNTMEVYNNGQWFPLNQTKGTNSQTFTATGRSTWTVPTGVYKVSVVVVGAGGGGGGADQTNACGAGGAGGCVIVHRDLTVIPGSVINVAVGTGGAGGTNSGNAGTNGTASRFGMLSTGGASGGNGSTGNGSAFANSSGATVSFPTNPGSTTYTAISSGNQGGWGTSFGTFLGGAPAGTANSTELAGGGGGQSADGGSAVAATSAGNGGAGVSIDFSGSSVTYGGGGGGGAYTGKTAGTGGSGGGGAGGVNAAGTNGSANTGGGGGGASGANAGGNGGSGFVGVYWYL